MFLRLAGLVTPALLFAAAGPVAAQHHGGGHGGGHGGAHMGGAHMGGAYHGGGGAYHHGGGVYHGGGGYYGGSRGFYSSPFYGGYGLGGYGLGYGLGGLGYGYGLGGYGLGRGYYGGSYGGGYYGGGSVYPYSSFGNYSYAVPAASAALGVPVVSGTYAPQPAPSGGFNAVTPSEPAPASVTVTVPEGAELWFNGKDMGKDGGSQVFTSPVMQPGQTATLAVKARWNGNTREMQLPIRAGDKMTVDLTRQ
jgi:uncharacterized protein (TIGR03000 family)